MQRASFHEKFLAVRSLNSMSEVCGTIQCMNRGVCMLCENIILRHNQLHSLFYLYYACLIHLSNDSWRKDSITAQTTLA